jgi:hypothetical protein
MTTRTLFHADTSASGRGQGRRTRVHLVSVDTRVTGDGPPILRRSALCGACPEYGFTTNFGGLLGGGHDVGLTRRLNAGKACPRCAVKVKPGDIIANVPAPAHDRLRICLDHNCPACDWPETWGEGAFVDDKLGAPDVLGCSRCGWRQPLDPTRTEEPTS